MRLARVLDHLRKPATDQPAPATDIDLSKLLQQFLSTEEPRRYTPGGRFYPSGLADCDRALGLHWLRAPETVAECDPRLQLTFLFGHSIHDTLQDIFAQIAAKKGWTFEREVKIDRLSNPWFISGRVDGILTIPLTNVTHGIEIKSINNEGYKSLWKAPKIEHVEQGNIYQGLKTIHHMHYLYVNKDKSTHKPFVVPFDTRLFRETMSRFERVLLTMQTGQLPSCDHCTSRCRFYGINREAPKANVNTFAHEGDRDDLENWRPTYLKGTVHETAEATDLRPHTRLVPRHRGIGGGSETGTPDDPAASGERPK